MAGPEVSTTSNHHHGNSSDPSDLRLQDSDDSAFMDEKHGISPPDPDTSDILKQSNTTDTATELEPGTHFRIDLRDGKEKKKTVQPPQTSQSKTSQAVCQSDEGSDVFDVSGHHPHLFFIEDDDDDSEEEKVGTDDAFEDDDSKNETEQGCFSSRNKEFESDTENEDSTMHGHRSNEENDDFQDVPRQTSLGLSQLSSSPLTTVCRRGSHSQVVVRCQIQGSASSTIRHASSCPNAFSPIWTQVRARATASAAQPDEDQCQKRRHYTISSPKKDYWQLSPRQREGHDPESPQDDPTHVTFKGRGRSYSDSDVQHLLIKEVSKELRRIGDEFDRLKTRRRTPVITEPIMEEGHGVCEM